jgi:hypothetical protein
LYVKKQSNSCGVSRPPRICNLNAPQLVLTKIDFDRPIIYNRIDRPSPLFFPRIRLKILIGKPSIRISPGYCHHSPVGFGGMGDRRIAGGTEATN